MYSVFLETKLSNNKKISEYIFYYGNLSNVDLPNDWRFYAIDNKREQTKFIGLADFSEKGTIEYPIKLMNGEVLEKFNNVENVDKSEKIKQHFYDKLRNNYLLLFNEADNYYTIFTIDGRIMMIDDTDVQNKIKQLLEAEVQIFKSAKELLKFAEQYEAVNILKQLMK